MKAIVIAALLALSFTTGFTCSKNQPEQTEATPAATEAAPAEGQPATEAAPADATATPAPTEAAPAAPAETK
ncbi:acylneuraminate cytidylyltransferase [Bdellovibrio sp. HCB2-146]|uniref:acylneuraminate cytidylyltransferase n=1 Tax=Bdellovibrio sp. HCB2-146 TaxID=3394362 RepID=UPI0039BC438B